MDQKVEKWLKKLNKFEEIYRTEWHGETEKKAYYAN